MIRCTGPLAALLLVGWTAPACGHYLWLTVDRADDAEEINMVFEESSRPGDGSYLDHFIGSSKTWVRTLDRPSPQLVEMKEVKRDEQRWLQSPLKAKAPRSVEAYGKFGVYAYGDTKVLLHYYAKYLDAESHEALHELGRAEQMDLDIVPHDYQGRVDLTLTWKGKPAAGRRVFIRGPGGFRQNPTTDKRGRVSLTPKTAGRYSFRSSVEQPTPGEEKGEKYDLIRHNITMLMRLPLAN